MPSRFVSESIRPVPGSMAPRPGVAGEPCLPDAFTWGDKTFAIRDVLERWKETGPCTHGSGESYVRKHWFRVATADGREMKIYFERRPRSARDRTRRWWLHSLQANDTE